MLPLVSAQAAIPIDVAMVRNINITGTIDSNPTELTSVNDTLFFAANDGTHGTELWKSNGTENGTQLVKDINANAVLNGGNSNPSDLTNVNGTLFFTADDGVHGRELWKSDGTETGTQLVRDINTSGSNGSNPQALANLNGTLLFSANDGTHGYELWKSDGTFDGTVMVKDINPNPAVNSGHSSPYNLTNVNGTLYFSADDGTHGIELWKSNGTDTGTVLVKDINTTGTVDSNPHSFTYVNGTLYFIADDGVHGLEVWKSDGTDNGTQLLKDVYTGSTGSYPDQLTNVNGILFFEAEDELHGSELWKSNGTGAETVIVKDIVTTAGVGSYPYQLTNVNGTLFFKANDGIHGEELWKSNGSDAGTVMVKDINSGSASSLPRELSSVNGTLFFSANDGTHAFELWKSDGTNSGTVMVKDINVGSFPSDPGLLTNVNGTVFFSADDGVNGFELWKTNSAPPTISLAFAAPTVSQGQPVALTATLTNAHWGPLSSLGYSHVLPANLVVASSPNVANTCGGTVSASAGAGTISLSGGTLVADGTCTVRVNVNANIVSTYMTATGAPSALETGSGLASNNVTLNAMAPLAPPAITVAFAASSASLGRPVALIATLSNPDSAPLSGLSFSEGLPVNLVVASPPSVANTCGGTVSATAGGSIISLSGGTLAPNAICTVGVNVTAKATGTYLIAAGAPSAAETGAGVVSNSATLNVATNGSNTHLYLPLVFR